MCVNVFRPEHCPEIPKILKFVLKFKVYPEIQYSIDICVCLKVKYERYD